MTTILDEAVKVKEVTYANKVAVTTILDEAVKVIRQTRSTLDSVDIEEDDIIDLAVSFDGSWMTRGHKSLYGIGCVVDIVTGFVIDFVTGVHVPVRGMVVHTLQTFCSGRPITETATSTTVALPGGWRRKLPKYCGSDLSTTFDSDSRPCCLMGTPGHTAISAA